MSLISTLIITIPRSRTDKLFWPILTHPEHFKYRDFFFTKLVFAFLAILVSEEMFWHKMTNASVRRLSKCLFFKICKRDIHWYRLPPRFHRDIHFGDFSLINIYKGGGGGLQNVRFEKSFHTTTKNRALLWRQLPYKTCTTRYPNQQPHPPKTKKQWRRKAAESTIITYMGATSRFCQYNEKKHTHKNVHWNW